MLKPTILPEVLRAQQEEVCRLIRIDAQKAREFIHEYDEFAPLLSRQAEEDVDQFLQEQHSFDDVMAEVERYQQLDRQLRYVARKVRPTASPRLLCFCVFSSPGTQSVTQWWSRC